jgi:hypothetical protein
MEQAKHAVAAHGGGLEKVAAPPWGPSPARALDRS